MQISSATFIHGWPVHIKFEWQQAMRTSSTTLAMPACSPAVSSMLNAHQQYHFECLKGHLTSLHWHQELLPWHPHSLYKGGCGCNGCWTDVEQMLNGCWMDVGWILWPVVRLSYFYQMLHSCSGDAKSLQWSSQTKVRRQATKAYPRVHSLTSWQDPWHHPNPSHQWIPHVLWLACTICNHCIRHSL